MQMKCAHCGESFEANASRVNRASKIGAPLYCGQVCTGLSRRVERSEEERKAIKAAYDKKRRAEQGEKLREQKRVAYYAKHDEYIAKHAEYRKKRMPKHVEYCRRPEYKAYKHQYDTMRAEAEYAEFAETWRLLQDLEREIRSQATAYEVRVANGYYTRNAQKRRRELWQLKQRN